MFPNKNRVIADMLIMPVTAHDVATCCNSIQSFNETVQEAMAVRVQKRSA